MKSLTQFFFDAERRRFFMIFYDNAAIGGINGFNNLRNSSSGKFSQHP
jgi:hypothetical protein